MAISYDRLIITQYPNIRDVEFTISRKLNDHFRLDLTGLIDFEQDIWKRGENEPITIKTEDHVVLFSGVIWEESFLKVGQVTKVLLTAFSATKLLDQIHKTRSFQDVKSSYADVINEIEHEYSQAVIMDTASNGALIKKLIVQYKETDWEFLKRLASHFSAPLVCSSRYETPAFTFGIANSNNIAKIDNQEFSCRYCENRKQILVDEDQYFDLCKEVLFQNHNMLIIEAKTVFQKGLIENHYVLSEERYIKFPQYFNSKIVGASLEGTVLHVDADRVYITLDVDQKKGVYPFLYSTNYSMAKGSGWYAMPEKSDKIRVTFPDSREHMAYSISSIHTKPSKYRSDPEIKRFRDKYGNDIIFAPEYIKICTPDGSYIKMRDNGNCTVHATGDLSLSAGKDIELSATGKVTMDAGSNIALYQGANNIVLSEDIIFTGEDVYYE